MATSPTPHPRLDRRIRRFFTTALPLIGILHAYIGWQILPALPLGAGGRCLGAILLMLSALLVPAGMLARFLALEQKLADRIVWLGSICMGLFSSLFVLTLLRSLSLFLFDGFSYERFSAYAVVIGALLATAIGFVNARRVARVVHVDVPLAGLPAALEGFSIAQLSDIHVGSTIKRDYVQAIVDRVNSLHADLIAITGDLVDGGVSLLTADVAPLAALRARHGVYCVTGNHEYYSGAAAWVAEFERLGMRVLLNAHDVVEHEGARLVVAGVTDFSAGYFDPAQQSDPQAALAGSPQSAPKVLLAHQPRSAVAAAAVGFDLQLSGHTHGGQFWPWNLFVVLQQPFTAGLHRLRDLWVYTSRGTGYWGPPKRFGAPSEITLLRLRRA